MKRYTGASRCLLSMFLLQGALVTASLFLSAADCRTVYGSEVKLTPACELKEEFNDNVFLTAGNKKNDFITTITPGLGFLHSSERLTIDLLAGLSWHDYARTSGVATTDYQYTGQLATRITQRDDLGLNAAYIRNTRPDTITTSTGLPTTSGSSTYQYSGNMRRLLDETTSAALSYSFNKAEYDNPASEASRVHSAGLVFSKDLGELMPRLKGTLNTNFSRSLYSFSHNDIYTVSVGASRSITEQLNLNLSAGEQLIHSALDTVPQRRSDSWESIGSASLNYTAEQGFGAFSVTHNFTPASGQVGAVLTSTFALSLGRNLSDKTTAQCAASYNLNRADKGQYASRGVDDRALNLNAGITYKFSNYFDISLQYAYYTVNNVLDDQTVSQNRIMVRAVSKYPFTW
ncbi:MAG TPA: outer membrane beta-barrel protein [Desulfuromonadales bacterium]|nr:outer membrane beta-barrel protein [Desulfuromonadales bacterium]